MWGKLLFCKSNIFVYCTSGPGIQGMVQHQIWEWRGNIYLQTDGRFEKRRPHHWCLKYVLYVTWTFVNLTADNVVYAIECTLCGLIYVGETKGELRKRMNGHRSQINNGGNQLLYRHFNLPDHSVLSMKVRILEKTYHPIKQAY